MLEVRVVLINTINILSLRVFLVEGKYFYEFMNTLSTHRGWCHYGAASFLYANL